MGVTLAAIRTFSGKEDTVLQGPMIIFKSYWIQRSLTVN